VQGHFFKAGTRGVYPTVILVPGWPGDPNDVLDQGALLSRRGINLLVFNPRGMFDSEGLTSVANGIADVGAALRWLRGAEVIRQFHIDTSRIAIGGHSYGGALAMAYAAGDLKVRRVFSIAGSDFGVLNRAILGSEEFGEAFSQSLLSTRVPDGPVAFELESVLQELTENQHVFGLQENAANLADRSILLIGGWDDMFVSIDQYLLPLYRALKREGAEKVTIAVYQDDHEFSQVRGDIANRIRDWIRH
jgi:pimeloyl-ACP methyl ester carboxylesterase